MKDCSDTTRSIFICGPLTQELEDASVYYFHITVQILNLRERKEEWVYLLATDTLSKQKIFPLSENTCFFFLKTDYIQSMQLQSLQHEPL